MWFHNFDLFGSNEGAVDHFKHLLSSK